MDSFTYYKVLETVGVNYEILSLIPSYQQYISHIPDRRTFRYRSGHLGANPKIEFLKSLQKLGVRELNFRNNNLHYYFFITVD